MAILKFKGCFISGSGYRSVYGPSYLKPYSSAIWNMTVMHHESAVNMVETY